MGSASRVRRTNADTRTGRSRANEAAIRLGRGLRERRTAAGWTQRALAVRIGMSQPHISDLERGRGATATIETWACAGAAVGLRLAAFFEMAPGASLPRDHEHLRRQELLLRLAASGGWQGAPEVPIDPDAAHSRSIDLLLRRTDDLLVLEVWDLLDDVGKALRGLSDKVAAMRRAYPRPTVGGVLVVRGTTRNRRVVATFARVFRTRFPAPSAQVLRALLDPAAPPPAGDSLIWTDVAGTRLMPWRPRSDRGRSSMETGRMDARVHEPRQPPTGTP